MKKHYTPSYCYDRAGHWATKCLQASARGDYDKAGRYRTKQLQWGAHGRRAEEKVKQPST